MEKVDCEKLTKEMRECVSENKGTFKCKELIVTFEKSCIKEENKI